MKMHSRHWPRWATRWAISSAVSIMSALLLLCGTGFGPPTMSAHASTVPLTNMCGVCSTPTSAMTLKPASGPAGTIVKVYISYQPADTPATYTLAATTTNPASGGCQNAQAVPGVASFRLLPPPPANTTKLVGFHWPASLGLGQYWLCALPTANDGTVLYAVEPFTVVTGTVLQPSVVLANAHVEPGGVIQATISNWSTMDDAAPHLYVLAQGNQDAAAVDIANDAQLQTADTSAGTFSYNISLPDDLHPGVYMIVAKGDCSGDTCDVRAQSASFTIAAIVPVATPTTAQATHDGALSYLASSPQALLVGAGILLLLLVIAFFILVPDVRRRRRRRIAAGRRYY